MDEQPPQEAPAQDDDADKPKIFQNVNGMIAGVTGLLVAAGGLAATWDRIFPSKPAEQEVAAPAAAAMSEPAATDAATDATSEPEAGDPTYYEGDGVKLEWVGEEWQLVESDTIHHLEEMYSSDDTRFLAFDKASSAYLRWPIKGGMAEMGSPDKLTWTAYVELEPVEQ